MQIAIGNDTLFFKDELTFGDQLDLTDIQQKYASQGMGYKVLIFSMMRIFIKKINEETDIDKNIQYIENIKGNKNITLLSESFSKHVENITQDTEKKSKK